MSIHRTDSECNDNEYKWPDSVLDAGTMDYHYVLCINKTQLIC